MRRLSALLLLSVLWLAACSDGDEARNDAVGASDADPAREPDTPAPHDEEAERVADGRAPYEALPDMQVDPASGVRYAVLDTLLRSDDTLDTARARLGAPNIVPDTLPGAEGEAMAGWTMYPGHPTRELSVYLDEAGLHPASIVADEDVSEWRRADGVAIGMNSNELAELNGRPFDFLGFDWDYGGLVTDWNGGALARQGDPTGSVRLCPPEPIEGMPPPDLPMGDAEFTSDDPRMQDAPGWVCELGVNLGP